MDSESLKEAVNRLVGDITAEAETLHDEQALKNLYTAEDMIVELVSDLCSNARRANESAYSVSKIAMVSYNLLLNLVANNLDVFEKIVDYLHKEAWE